MDSLNVSAVTDLTPLERYNDQTIDLANVMVRAREHTNLLESKIEVLAIHHMGDNKKRKSKHDASGNPYEVDFVEVTASEIRSLMGRTDGDTYGSIRKAAIALKSRILIMEDKESKRFYLRNMYGDISYNNGILYVEFEPSMEKYFLNLKNNFTRLSLPILFSFKKNGGFQLYKLLKSYAFNQHLPEINDTDLSLPQEDFPSYSVPFDLTNLRMQLGYIDLNQKALLEEGSKSKPNFEKMKEVEKKPQYKRWSDFYARVIAPGVEEINELSDIYIKRAETDKGGRGGKIRGIVFEIQHNKKYYMNNRSTDTISKENSVPVDTFDLIDELRDMIDMPLKTKELMSIANAANMDYEKIKKAYEVTKATKNVEDFVGFMIAAIKNGYDMPKKQIDPDERDYDFEELTKKFVKN